MTVWTLLLYINTSVGYRHNRQLVIRTRSAERVICSNAPIATMATDILPAFSTSSAYFPSIFSPLSLLWQRGTDQFLH